MDELHFIKMHGLGNDFIVIDLRAGGSLPPKDILVRMMDRKTGIGCDQLIPVLPPKTPGTDAFMRIINAPDASEVEACGNATRCVADLIMREKRQDRAVIETVAGKLECVRTPEGLITADMGAPRLGWADIPLSEERDTLHLEIVEGDIADPVGVNVGNPHAVFFVEGVEDLPVHELGPRFETDPLFPQKANIEFVEVRSRTELRMRVWERDTGETQACGSAACASVVAAVRRGLAERTCSVILNGGLLEFNWREEDDHILMTGPAAHVFEGVWPL